MISLTNGFMISLMVICAIVLFLSIRVTYKNKPVVSLLAPIVMGLIIYMTFTIKEIQSLPIEEYPEEFTFVHYITDGEDIFLWGIDVGKDYPQTWKFPYSDQAEEDLRRAAGDAAQGVRVKMRERGEASNIGGFERITHSDRSPDDATNHLKDYLKYLPSGS